MNRYNSLLGKVAPIDYRSHVSEVFRFSQDNLPDTPFLMAGSRDWHALRGHFVSQLYSGKIDRCGVFDRVLSREELDAIRTGESPPSYGMVAYWDTTKGYTDRGIGDLVVDIGPNHLDANGYNRPVRAQTGYNWNGRNDCFRLAPHEYGGIEFHADAMIDSNWKVTRTLELPETLRSGAYAMRLRGGDGTGLGEEYIVFFVRPRVPTGRIAFPVFHGDLSCLCQRTLRNRRPYRAADGRPAADDLRGRYRDLRKSGIRRGLLRLARGRCRYLLQQLSSPDGEHAARNTASPRSTCPGIFRQTFRSWHGSNTRATITMS